MKQKILYTILLSSVFISPALADEPLTVSVGGYMTFTAGVVGEDGDAGFRSHDFKTDSEVRINAEGEVDGLVYGASIGINTDQDADVNGDAPVIYLEGSWGRLELGDYDAASQTLQIYAPTDFGLGGFDELNDTTFTDFIVGNIGLTGLYEPLTSDESTKITYLTPRWNGFQAGVSYAPQGMDNGQAVDRSDFSPVAQPGVISIDDFEDIVEFGVGYETELNAVALGFSGSYGFGSARKDPLSGFADHEDMRAWSLGMSIGYENWTFAGGYVNNGDSGYLETATEDDSAYGFNFGLQYVVDGEWSLGASYLKAESEGDLTTVADDELDVSLPLAEPISWHQG